MKNITVVFLSFMSLLLSACATDLASTLKSRDIEIKDKKLIDTIYGYSFELPESWILLDEDSFRKLDYQVQKMLQETLSKYRVGYRATFFQPNSYAYIIVCSYRYGFYDTTQEVIKHADMEFSKMCDDDKELSSCEIDKFEILTTRNYYGKSPGAPAEMLYYLEAYEYGGSINGVYLFLVSASHFSKDYLPQFLNCVRSLDVRKASGQVKNAGDVEDRLRGLKSLREKGLISEEEYNEKKRKVLEDF